jgi:hypothetical protein
LFSLDRQWDGLQTKGMGYWDLFLFFLGTGKGVSEKWLVGVLAIRNYQFCASSNNERGKVLSRVL